MEKIIRTIGNFTLGGLFLLPLATSSIFLFPLTVPSAFATGGLPFPMDPEYVPPSHPDRPKYDAEKRRKMIHELLRSLDRNGDGRVSIEEFEEGTERNFSHLDTNGDGYISREEMGVIHK
ncbi:EF-hand domain-containing protein [Candidatus Nitrosacidococcus tergens]|uniref:EF-hand domain-containing protein n=1 Tax=Candidatus Nitrosacidococcus tergens TaxID=553981 RepID=A0A7G1Q763_9GAMM|nr:EF-hand domain-containing protein [Candidatus Nitrosacidococcus tergens]CAB1274174.1 protein of unknown function [Candidatus Nitrosacidococcus tergens]